MLHRLYAISPLLNFWPTNFPPYYNIWPITPAVYFCIIWKLGRVKTIFGSSVAVTDYGVHWPGAASRSDAYKSIWIGLWLRTEVGTADLRRSKDTPSELFAWTDQFLSSLSKTIFTYRGPVLVAHRGREGNLSHSFRTSFYLFAAVCVPRGLPNLPQTVFLEYMISHSSISN